ncbi:fibronectin type III domain-containing protein, partial [archaeon]|nr:fibronectin type III domain-containing protein [archaeon]
NNNFYKHTATILVTLTLTLILLNSLFPTDQLQKAPPTTTQKNLNFEFHTVELPYYDHDSYFDAEIPLFNPRKGDLEFVQLDLQVGAEHFVSLEVVSGSASLREFNGMHPLSSLMFFKNQGDESPYFFGTTSNPPSIKSNVWGPSDGTADYAGSSGNEESFYSDVARQFPSKPITLTSKEDLNYFTKNSASETKTISYFTPGLYSDSLLPSGTSIGIRTLIGGELSITYGYNSKKEQKNQKPATPSNFQASVNTLPYIHLTWDKSQGAVNYAIFKTYYNSQNPPTQHAPCDKGYLREILNDVDEFKDIQTGTSQIVYSILAIGPLGQSKCSNWIVGQGTGPQGSPPMPPQNVILSSPSSGKIDVNWNQVSGATGYEVRKAIDSVGPFWIMETINNPSTTIYSEDNVAPGTYYYRIKAFNDWGYSDFSDRVSGITV